MSSNFSDRFCFTSHAIIFRIRNAVRKYTSFLGYFEETDMLSNLIGVVAQNSNTIQHNNGTNYRYIIKTSVYCTLCMVLFNKRVSPLNTPSLMLQ